MAKNIPIQLGFKGAAWFSSNPNYVLKAGQIVFLSTTSQYKIGDGTTVLSALSFNGGTTSTLANTLLNGNTTGASDIVATNNSKYRNSDSSVNLNISNSGLIEFTNTDGSYTYSLDSDVTSQYIQMRSYDNATSLELAYFQSFYQQVNMGVYSAATGGRLTQLEITNGEIKTNIVNNASFAGIKYGADYSANYTNRSLVDKGYVTGNFQPLNSNLTSWAGVTRASGFDTFVSTPSSANLASLVTDETGSGALVFGTSPTFTTDITVPQINATSTTLLINGNLSPSTTNTRSLGSGSNIWSAITVNNILTAALRPISNTITLQNAGATLSYGTFELRTGTSGAVTNFTFDIGTHTGQSSGVEISNFKVNGASKTWAAGAITTQRWNYFTANTAAFASTSTITNSYGLYVEKATAGSNAIITNNYALGGNGSFNFTDGTRSLAYTLAAANTLIATGDSSSKMSVVSGTRVMSMINFAADLNYLGSTGATLIVQTSDSNMLKFQTNNTDRFTIGTAGSFTIADANNFIFNATTGTKLGTATTQKLAFWNATPIVQPSGAAQAALAPYATGAFGLDSNANMQAMYDLVMAMRTVLVNTGLMKGAA